MSLRWQQHLLSHSLQQSLYRFNHLGGSYNGLFVHIVKGYVCTMGLILPSKQ